MSLKDAVKNMIGSGNGETQPSATPESEAPKTPYVISEQVKADIIEDVSSRFASVGPSYEIKVPSIEDLIAKDYKEDVAEKMVVQEQFKADVLAHLKEEAAAAAPPAKVPEPNPYLHSEEVDQMVADGYSRTVAARMVETREADKERQERLGSGKKFRFRVLTPVSFDDRDYVPGELITLTQAQADEMPWAVELIKEGRN